MATYASLATVPVTLMRRALGPLWRPMHGHGRAGRAATPPEALASPCIPARVSFMPVSRQTIYVPNAVASKRDSVGAGKDDISLSAQRVAFETEGRKIQGWYRIRVLSPQRPLERLVIEAPDRAGNLVGGFDSVMPGNRFTAYVFVGSNVASLALHHEPCDCGDAASVTLRAVSSLEFVWRSLKSAFLRDVIFSRPLTFLRSFLRPPRSLFVMLDFRRPQTFFSEEEIYRWWIEKRGNDALKRTLAPSHCKNIARPSTSILMSVRDPDPRYLRKAIESAMRQTSPNWELCIAIDASTGAAARQRRNDFDGAQGYDANLRMIEVIDETQIGHVPAILYHRRERGRHPPGAEATHLAADPCVIAAGKRALEQHLARRAADARVEMVAGRNVVTPFAELFHFESRSRGYEDTPEKRLRFAKGMQVMRDRHGGDVARDPCYSPHLAGAPDDFLIAVK